MHEGDPASFSETLASSYASLRSSGYLQQHRNSQFSSRPPSRENNRSRVSNSLPGAVLAAAPMADDSSGGSVAGVLRKLACGLLLSCVVCCLWIVCVNSVFQLYGIAGGDGRAAGAGCSNVSTPVANCSESNAAVTATPVNAGTAVVATPVRLPFLLTYLSGGLLTLCYPVYMVFCACWLTADLSQLRDLHRLNMVILSGELSKVKIFAIRAAIFTLIWDFMLYCIYRSLTMIPGLDLITMFAVSPSFTYLLSWVVLQRKFLGVRIIAFLLGTSGVILLVYINKSTMWLRTLAAFSAGSFAIFRTVLDRTLVPYIPHLGQVMLVLSVIGVCTLLALWPGVLLLSVWLRLEPGLSAATPWQFVLGAASSNCLLFLMLHLGNFITYHLLVSFGLLLAIVVELFLHVFWLETLRFGTYVAGDYGDFPPMRLAGISAVCLAFLLTFVPEGWQRWLARLCHLDQYAMESRKVRRVVK